MSTIIMLHTGGGQARGSEVCLIESIKALSDNGFKIILLRKNSILDEFVTDYVDTILDEPFPEIMFDGDYRSFPLAGYARSLRRLYRLAKLHKSALFYCNSGLPCQLAVPVGKLLSTAVLCHFHHPAPRRYFYFWLVRFATRLVFPSNYTRQFVMEKCGRSGEVVYNAVDMESRFVPAQSRDGGFRELHDIDKNAIVVGQVGNLSPHKRPDMLVRCFAAATEKIDNLHLVLVGDGPIYNDLMELVDELDLSRVVTLAGYVPDVLPYYQHVIDVNVLASSEEGLGISVIEASACGVPSIVTDCTGLREVVDEGVTGLTFGLNDSGKLTDDIVKLASDLELRNRLGVTARENAVKKFSLESYRKNIVFQVESARY